MKNNKHSFQFFKPLTYAGAILLFILSALMTPYAMALTVTVNGADNTVSPAVQTQLTGYRWLIEEDGTYHGVYCKKCLGAYLKLKKGGQNRRVKSSQ